MYPDPDHRIFNRVFLGYFRVQSEATLTISDSIKTDSPVESEIVRVISRSTTETTEITRFKKETSNLKLVFYTDSKSLVYAKQLKVINHNNQSAENAGAAFVM